MKTNDKVNDKASRSWCFTLNNYDDQDVNRYKGFECKYIRFGEEVGDKGTKHLQGVLVLDKPSRLSALKKIDPKAHWEPCKALEASINYCNKGANIFTKDNRSQGKRTDLEAVVEDIKAGKRLKEVATNNPISYIKYHSGIEKLIEHYQEERNFKPEVTWIWGPSERGKTTFVREKEKDLWFCAKNLKWWDGYQHQEAVLFDEFRADFCTFHELLRILDRFPYRVESKGSSRELNSKRMYITSPFHPKDVYKKTSEEIKQLLRRIDVIIEM